ncbi:MAG: recombinase family protein [Desulfarculaceae bacterium]|nr:recombinase family protein [Desulfarculaceae bacterium]
MSDFLKNLRGPQTKQPKTRKEMGGHYSTHVERRQTKDRRKDNLPSSPEINELAENLNQLLPVLNENMASIAVSMERIAEANEYVTEPKVEQSNVINNLLRSLNDLLTSADFASSEKAGPIKYAATSYENGTRYTKEEVLSIIQEMRKEGETFASIASYLKEKGIPTFSGRGDWHAQTIHRLCK